MSELNSSEEVKIAAGVLRTNLSETERLLNKFNESARRYLVEEGTKGKPNEQDINTMKQTVEALKKLQTDFNDFKADMDVLLALFSK